MTRYVPVSHQHRHVSGEPLRAERGGTEGRGHREEDHGAALGGGQDGTALAAGDVDADDGDIGGSAGGPDLGGPAYGGSRVGDDYFVGPGGGRGGGGRLRRRELA